MPFTTSWTSYKAQEEAKANKKRRKRDELRQWLTLGFSAVAALAAVAAVVLQAMSAGW